MDMCIGFLEYISIGRGIEAADLISKNSDIDILLAAPNCPGRYQILFTGDVGAVKSALDLAQQIADFNFLDSIIIPRIDEKVVQALYTSQVTEITDGIAIFETMTMSATLMGADTMVKSADVDIVELRLGKGLAGKSFVIVTGSIQNLKAAMDAALEMVEEKGVLISGVVVPSLSEEVKKHVLS